MNYDNIQREAYKRIFVEDEYNNIAYKCWIDGKDII